MSTPIQNRYDFVYLFDVTDGNPNGDPDAGNLPRVDAETGQGLVTDVCLKRKIRNYIDQTSEGKNGLKVFVREGDILNRKIKEAYEQSEAVKASLKSWSDYEKAKKDKKLAVKPTAPDLHYEDVARQWMCEQFWDIRTFGAVMSTGKDEQDDTGESKIRKTAGQVRGPVQLTIARSISPIFSHEHSLTVCAARTEDKTVEAQTGIQGRKYTVPYGLYRCHGFISATLADLQKPGGTGFSDDDLALLKQSLNLMFENDRSAAHGLMKPVRCIAFRHECKLGNARADQLFGQIKVELKDNVKVEKRPPRSADDYSIRLDDAPIDDTFIQANKDGIQLSKGVTAEIWV